MDFDRDYEWVYPVCACGRQIGELGDPVDGEPLRGTGYKRGDTLFRYTCSSCRDVIRDFYFEGAVQRRHLLVIHTLNVETGEVLLDRVEIFRDHELNNRTGDRGGKRLDPEILQTALRRRSEGRRTS